MQKPRSRFDIAIYTAAGLVASYILFAAVAFIDAKYFESKGFFALPETLQVAVRVALVPVAYILSRLGIVG